MISRLGPFFFVKTFHGIELKILRLLWQQIVNFSENLNIKKDLSFESWLEIKDTFKKEKAQLEKSRQLVEQKRQLEVSYCLHKNIPITCFSDITCNSLIYFFGMKMLIPGKSELSPLGTYLGNRWIFRENSY